MIIGNLGIAFLADIGIKTFLLKFNQTPVDGFYFNYSDLSGHSQDLIAFAWYKLYWTILGMLLLSLALLFWRRERSENFGQRLKLAQGRANGQWWVGFGIGLMAFASLGFYLQTKEQEKEQWLFNGQSQSALLSAFQKKYTAYQDIPQPKITAFYTTLDVYPKTNDFLAEGYFTLINPHNSPIDTILVKAGFDEISQLELSRTAQVIAADSVFKFSIFDLNRPLAPGDSLRLNFSIRPSPNLLLLRNSNVLSNGTFLQRDIFPQIGYFANIARPLPSDSTATQQHYQSRDADLIRFEAIVSTPKSQRAIAPGYLQKEWEENGRRFVHYKMDQPIKSVFGFNIGEFEQFEEEYEGVQLSIYHHPSHDYCLPQMMEGLKAALRYNTQHFSPYQHRAAHIVEFSRTDGSFATTAANVIPTSETRFVMDPNKVEEGYHDLSFYVVAHELTHQWWGNQVMPANALGAWMVTESVTEYVTARVYEATYGKELAEAFIQLQRKRYLRGRANKRGEEVPLALVDDEQTYLSYGKGAFTLYQLSEQIGAEKMSKALQKFLLAYQFQGPPYPTSLALIDTLRAATPDSLQYLIHDYFETITFYDNQLLSAQSTPLSNGEYQLDIEFLIQKYRQTEKEQRDYEQSPISYFTNEQDTLFSLPLADYIEIGIYTREEEKPSQIHRLKVTDLYNKRSFLLKEAPQGVRLDPKGQLLEIERDNNQISLSN